MASDAKKRGGKTGDSPARAPRSATKGLARGGARAAGDGRAKSGANAKAGSARVQAGANAKGGVRTRASGPSNPASPPTPASVREHDDTRDLALAAIEAALEKKALMPVLIDVSAMASYTDFIGIVSGRSDRQVEAIADGVSLFMKSRGRRVIGQEGSGNGRWTLLDFGEIVIHVFYHPVREFYDLESLWIDAPRVKMAIPAGAILTQPDALYGAL